MALLVTTCAALIGTSIANAGYDQHARFNEFASELEKEHGIPAQQTAAWLKEAERLDSVLEAIARPAEKTKTWADYRKIFLTEKRISQGKQFIKDNAELLEKAEKEFGVPKEIIASIIGVETFYGQRQGNYRVLDSLSTLAFDYPKRSLFWRELKEFFVMSQEQGVEPRDIKGSYAGAMGYGQFIPSSYRHYAIDYDGDGKKDLWTNKADAIGSVANYFKRHGWKKDQAVTQRVRVSGNDYQDAVNDRLKPKWKVSELKALGITPTKAVDDDASASLIKLMGVNGAEFWLGNHNFYVITRYNHSRMYAMAVYQLSLAIK
ncbi:MAG: lytic murein transglycosylase B [Oleispira sp.]|nr:lytic murein transglycosylase B [Oleispira sp.]MBL4798323.1 lytic murein transglycosylase B [Oleispira sp.]MBL4881079.1 lytic murein transglycosylase B [Oleispira sp.]